MIIINGTIQVIGKSGGGIDSNGDPIKATQISGASINCNFKLKMDKKFSYEIGETKVSTYEILIDTQTFNATKIRLSDNRSQTIGDFEVLNISYLDTAQRVKITV